MNKLENELLKVIRAWDKVVSSQNYETHKEYEDQVKIFEKVIEDARKLIPLSDFEKSLEGK